MLWPSADPSLRPPDVLSSLRPPDVLSSLRRSQLLPRGRVATAAMSHVDGGSVLTPLTRAVAWSGPDPIRIDAAQVVFERDSLTARGTSAVADHTVDWVLTTGPGWVTRRLSVRTRGDGWSRALEVIRAPDGTWSAERHDGGRLPERLDVSGLEEGLDCDLALCPFTNTMPVLRHDLVAAARRRERLVADLVVAWIAVPDLTVTVSPQQYSARGPAPDGGALIDFSSGDFQATIELDADSVVVQYPGIATRLHPIGDAPDGTPQRP